MLCVKLQISAHTSLLEQLKAPQTDLRTGCSSVMSWVHQMAERSVMRCKKVKGVEKVKNI